MSDETQGSVETGGEGTAGAMESAGFLTSGLDAGNPSGGMPNGAAPDLSTADGMMKSLEGAPPEWAPAKFWDKEKGEVRVQDLGKSYQNLEKLLGSSERVAVPTDWDDPEQTERFYKAVGVPDDPAGYEFKQPEQLPKDLPYDNDLESSFRNVARQNGLTPRQASALYDQYVKTQIERHAAYETMKRQERAELTNKLQREYGQQFNGAVQSAKNAMSKYADPDFRMYLDETGLADDPRMIRVFQRIGKEMAGETKLTGRAEQQSTPADIEASISEFRKKNEKALMDRSHPDNERLTNELAKLYQRKHPEAAY